MNYKAEGYQIWISILRITSTISVVFLHTCSTIAQNPDVFKMNDFQLRFYCASYQMMNWAVPVFLCLQGHYCLILRRILLQKIT